MKTFNDLRNELASQDPLQYISSEIVGKLIAARNRKDISQKELSELCGIPQKTISRIENGVDLPKLPTLVKLSSALDLQLEFALVEKKKSTEDRVH